MKYFVGYENDFVVYVVHIGTLPECRRKLSERFFWKNKGAFLLTEELFYKTFGFGDSPIDYSLVRDF